MVEPSIIKKNSFKAIGDSWQGTFQQAQAGEIKVMMQRFRERMTEIANRVDKQTIYGLSYDVTKEGFTYYLCCEVSVVDLLPEGMEAIAVPALTYATVKHEPEKNIEDTYSYLYNWIGEQGYSTNGTVDISHFEIYPVTYHPLEDRPDLVINIPVIV